MTSDSEHKWAQSTNNTTRMKTNEEKSTVSSEEAAEIYKEQGNAKFSANQYAEALDLYSKGISVRTILSFTYI